MVNLTVKAFSGVVSYYDQYMEESGHYQAERKAARFIAENVDVGLVLDVATGTGIMLEPFYDGVGVDVSREMVKEAKRKYGDKEFLVADAHHLPFNEGVFETALSCLAFLWFEDPEQALREMLRVARRVYVVEEEGVPARKRIEIPGSLKKFFETIAELEKEVYIEELDAYRSSLMYGRVYEADIDGSHRFVVWEMRGDKGPLGFGLIPRLRGVLKGNLFLL